MPIFRFLERVSHVFGVFASIIGLPAALFGAYVFSDEIIDRVTTPDVTLTAPRMTIRCFRRVTTQADLNAIRSGDTVREAELCGENTLSVGFLATFENQDRISRTVADITARLTLPAGAIPGDDGPVVLDLPWFVSDEIRGIADTNVRRIFTHIELPPQTTQREEIWIDQAAPVAQRITWEPVRTWLREGARAGDIIRTEILLHVAGEEDPLPVFTCDVVLAAGSLDTHRSFPLHGQRAFTGSCLS